MDLATLANDMQTQAQAIASAIAQNAGTSVLQTAYNALSSDAAAAQPLLAGLSPTAVGGATTALNDINAQLPAIYAVAFPFGYTASTAQLAAASVASTAVSNDAIQIAAIATTDAQNALQSGAVQSQITTAEQQAAAGAAAEAAAIAAEQAAAVQAQLATSEQQAAAGAAAQAAAIAAQHASGQLPPIPVSPPPASTSSSVAPALAIGGGALAIGALAWWWTR